MSRKDVPRTLRKAARLAERQGWHIDHKRGGHLKWYPPKPGAMIVTPSSPGEGRAITNVMAKLKRAGLDVPGRD
jgi:predicted RNA binding protein YcfA (HicA-like mRNA interferase family)